MSLNSKRELLSVVAPRYRRADRGEKPRILDEFVESTGYGRKHALVLLNHSPSHSRYGPLSSDGVLGATCGPSPTRW